MNNRFLDPIRWEELCYYLVYKYKVGANEQVVNVHWLGTSCGQKFLNTVSELIEKYPYKIAAPTAFLFGEIRDKEITKRHYIWFIHQFDTWNLKFLHDRDFDTVQKEFIKLVEGT